MSDEEILEKLRKSGATKRLTKNLLNVLKEKQYEKNSTKKVKFSSDKVNPEELLSETLG